VGKTLGCRQHRLRIGPSSAGPAAIWHILVISQIPRSFAHRQA
jgi:hypothetical protein